MRSFAGQRNAMSHSVIMFTITCRGCEKKTKGTAFVVYEDIFDAKRAQEGLSGFNVQNRYAASWAQVAPIKLPPRQLSLRQAE